MDALQDYGMSDRDARGQAPWSWTAAPQEMPGKNQTRRYCPSPPGRAPGDISFSPTLDSGPRALHEPGPPPFLLLLSSLWSWLLDH